MWLSKNEKKVLKLLVENAKLSDTSIAHKLNVSSQAIGRIRKKLEEELILGYTVNLDLSKLDINLFTLSEVEILNIEKCCIAESEKEILENNSTTTLIRLSGELNNYLISGGFKDLPDFHSLFRKTQDGGEASDRIKIRKTYFFSTENILKNSPRNLILKAIDELGANQLHRKYHSPISRFDPI